MVRDRIQAALKTALKSGDTTKLSTMRLIAAALKDKEIAARGKGGSDGIGDDEILAMLQTMVKQRVESARLYREGSREDLAKTEEDEIAVIRSFMPEQMDTDAMLAAINEVMVETGAGSVKDMGKVMGLLKERYSGRMDFTAASTAVKEALLNR